MDRCRSQGCQPRRHSRGRPVGRVAEDAQARERAAGRGDLLGASIGVEGHRTRSALQQQVPARVVEIVSRARRGRDAGDLALGVVLERCPRRRGRRGRAGRGRRAVREFPVGVVSVGRGRRAARSGYRDGLGGIGLAFSAGRLRVRGRRGGSAGKGDLLGCLVRRGVLRHAGGVVADLLRPVTERVVAVLLPVRLDPADRRRGRAGIGAPADAADLGGRSGGGGT